MRRRNILGLLAALALAACAAAGPDRTAAAPRAATPPGSGEALAAAADGRAVEAALETLARGGSATDGAIAAMMVLGLVEPQSAGLGGGGFLLHLDGATGAMDAFDGREKAPASATPALFLGADGQPLSYRDAVVSGRSIGAPSLVAMLKLAHEKHGRLPWADLFGPAIKLAEEGFVVSPRLATLIAAMAPGGGLQQDPAARAYFFDASGAPIQAGTVLRNPAYAATLRAIQAQGPEALRRGPIAEAIVASARAEPRPGGLSLADLASYAPRRLEPVCGTYRRHKVCGMGPPSSGGTTVLAILGLYERARPSPVGASDADDWSAFLWASRIAYADRDHYLADDEFVPVPARGLLDPRYLDLRSRAITPALAPAEAIAPGDPAAVTGEPSLLDRWGRDRTREPGGTTHLTVVDDQGRVAALTATIEAPFGAQRMAAGFLLNNQLTDFSRTPVKNGLPVANAPAGGKRPRSSMAPTIIFDPQGRFVAAIGSPGGSSIIGYVAKTVIGVIDWKLPMQQAIELPNLIASGPNVRAEIDRMPEGLAAALTARGWKLQPTTFEASGLHGAQVVGGKLKGGADPRREGIALVLPPERRSRR